MGNFFSGDADKPSKENKKWELTLGNEWKQLEQEDKDKYHQQSSQFVAALAGENVDKNRYQSVLAPDVSRVKLQVTTGSDYINANYIDGVHNKSKNAYVATQAPKPETIKDFWRMVWEQNISILIMLTNLEERGRLKANQYWPKSGSKSYGNITVSCHSVDEDNADWVVRKFIVRCGANTLKSATTMVKTGVSVEQPTVKTDSRMVTQFHFKTWPDMGVPEVGPLLEMMSQVDQTWCDAQKQNPKTSLKDKNPDPDVCTAPVLVHCSAGIGRTGTYIIISSFISKFVEENKLPSENSLALRPVLSAMRDQRPGLVQQKDQYAFCYRALKTALAGGVPLVGLVDRENIKPNETVTDFEEGEDHVIIGQSTSKVKVEKKSNTSSSKGRDEKLVDGDSKGKEEYADKDFKERVSSRGNKSPSKKSSSRNNQDSVATDDKK